MKNVLTQFIRYAIYKEYIVMYQFLYNEVSFKFYMSSC